MNETRQPDVDTKQSIGAVEDATALPNIVLDDERLTGHDLLAYLALCHLADEGGASSPTVAHLASIARTGETTLRVSLKRLQSLGYLSVTPRTYEDGAQGTNIYTVSEVTS